MQPNPNRKVALVIFAVVGVFVVAPLLFFVLTTFVIKKPSLRVISIPGDTSIQINGQGSSDKAKLKPGKYEVSVARDGFATFKQDVTITENQGGKQEPQVLVVTLVPITPEGYEVMKEYSLLDFLEVESLAGRDGSRRGEEIKNQAPIIRFLPDVTGFYSIDFSINNKNEFSLQIRSTTPMGRQVAIERIRQWGYDPTDFDITFPEGFTNVFGGNQQ